ncbi:MAG: septal ring lytic transglycosylase RlpA family protein [Aquificaceae bacterium]
MWIITIVFFLLNIAWSEHTCEGVEGYASWYGRKFQDRKTANGETFDMYKYTAASKVFPMNSYVLVKNMENGREVVVRITDRGPFIKGRILDLSRSSAEKIGVIKKGVIKVQAIPLSCVAEIEKDQQDEYVKDIINTF